MAPEQRKQLLLALLAIALATVAYRLWPGRVQPTVSGPTPSNVRTAGRTQSGPPAMTAPDVHLETLKEGRVEPGEVQRNLFRFKPKAAPAAQTPPITKAPPAVTTPTGPPPAPSMPPIALKFIGIWEMTEQKRKVAVLTDGRGGVPIYGGEGDTVEGRYKIVRIGAESIELTYLDGRGRQTIRLSGQ